MLTGVIPIVGKAAPRAQQLIAMNPGSAEADYALAFALALLFGFAFGSAFGCAFGCGCESAFAAAPIPSLLFK